MSDPCPLLFFFPPCLQPTSLPTFLPRPALLHLQGVILPSWVTGPALPRPALPCACASPAPHPMLLGLPLFPFRRRVPRVGHHVRRGQHPEPPLQHWPVPAGRRRRQRDVHHIGTALAGRSVCVCVCVCLDASHTITNHLPPTLYPTGHATSRGLSSRYACVCVCMECMDVSTLQPTTPFHLPPAQCILGEI